MKPLILLSYIALGLLIKVAGLLFLKHYDGYSEKIEMAYAVVLLCLLILRPLRDKKSIF